MPNGWRTINSLVHKIRLHGRRGKGMAESFSRQKSRHAPQKEGGLKILCDLPPVWPRLVRPTNLMSRMDGKKTQYDGGFLPDIILLTQCYYHRGTRLNAMKRFCIFSYWSHLNVLTFFPLTGGCSEGLGAFRFFFKHDKRRTRPQEECFVRSVVLDAHDLG